MTHFRPFLTLTKFLNKQIKKFVKLQKVKKMAVTPANSQKKENKENNGENQNKNNELDIGASITAKRADGSWHSANVVHRRTNPDTQETEYYVHYEGFNRRLDEWIKSDRIKLQADDNEPVTITNENDSLGKILILNFCFFSHFFYFCLYSFSILDFLDFRLL